MNKAAQDAREPADAARRPPAHELVYRRLRGLVLFGDLTPGEAVTIQGLADRLGAGVTPVREAIRRLIAEGALVSRGNRRVSVPLLSPENVNELMIARQWIDPYMAHRASERAAAREIRALAALDTALDAAIARGDLRAYLEGNYRFHRMIYDLAAAPILTDLADGLWLRFGPSLRVVCGRLGTQNLPDKHKEVLSAMRAGNAEAAAAAICEDVVQGMELVRDSLADTGLRARFD